MKRIKRFFGKIYLRTPKRVKRLINLSITMIVIVLIWYVFTVMLLISGKDVQSFFYLYLIMFVVLVLLLYLSLGADLWAKELPEYWIMEADRIIEKDNKNLTERFYSLRLGILVKECKEGKPDSFDSLKNFVSEIKRYESFKTRKNKIKEEMELLEKEQKKILLEARTLFKKQG